MNNNTIDDSTVIIIKDEEEEEDDIVLGAALCPPSMSGSLEVPRPMEGLNEAGPPPFLTKTYEMVEDPETGTVVSWGSGGDSFVVWDPYEFASTLLPKYFKHSNFSSFIRQLNTYGFRKVHLDRWEFVNSGFQRGMKHLLKTIKRRNHSANNQSKLQLVRETELEKLKKEQEALETELHDLKQRQQYSDKYLATMEERMKCAEWKHREFVMLIAKLMKRTNILQQLVHNYKQKKALGTGEILKKKRRLASSDQTLKDPFLTMGTTLNGDNQCHEEDSDIQSETDLFISQPAVDVSSSLTSETDSADQSSGSYIMWEKLMEDDVICEDGEEGVLEPEDLNKSNFVRELEDLIAMPPSWGSCNADVGEIACPTVKHEIVDTA